MHPLARYAEIVDRWLGEDCATADRLVAEFDRDLYLAGNAHRLLDRLNEAARLRREGAEAARIANALQLALHAADSLAADANWLRGHADAIRSRCRTLVNGYLAAKDA
jgi:hypothetical protein